MSGGPRRADVVVVGSRVAGAATALLLARAGHDVVVVDRTRHPSDTLSTHAIARGGVVQLARWGLLDQVLATGVPPIRQVAFHRDGEVVRRTVRERAGTDLLLAPRRHVLDPILAGAAVEAGARLVEEVSVVDVTTGPGGRADGLVVRERSGRRRLLRARHVVGADGLRSTVARSVGAPTTDRRPSTAATDYVYVAGLDADGFEYHLGGGGFAGVFPTNGGEACVWICSPAGWRSDLEAEPTDRLGHFHSLLDRIAPALAARVRAALVTAPVRGAAGLPNQVRAATGPGWWLVGDAGYHRDPITGHGITDALHHAELLAEALHASLTGLADERVAACDYERSRRSALAPVFDLTCELATFPDEDRFVALQRRLSSLLEDEALALAGTRQRPWTAELVAG